MDLAVEATPTLQQMLVLRVPAVDKGNGAFVPTPKEKHASPAKPKGIVISSPTASTATAPEEEGSVLRDDDSIPPSAEAPVGELTEEEQLALALKASMDTTLEEHAARCGKLCFL